ncbi:hypothetical protein [Aphanothece hegewaldii]|nr:hypothetical protein [Aphanothece hegewaldii]
MVFALWYISFVAQALLTTSHKVTTINYAAAKPMLLIPEVYRQ